VCEIELLVVANIIVLVLLNGSDVVLLIIDWYYCNDCSDIVCVVINVC